MEHSSFPIPHMVMTMWTGRWWSCQEQAEIVKQIFADTLAGKSTHEIANELNERGVATKKGGHWTPSTVNAIIGNEKYTGDVLFQKTYTDSSFNRHQNRGELDQYLMQDHHEAIIHEESWNWPMQF